MGTLYCNPLAFELRLQDFSLGSEGSEPWIVLKGLEAETTSPMAARRGKFERVVIDAELIRLEIDERDLFNLEKLGEGLGQLLKRENGLIEIEEAVLRVARLEIADYSSFLPRRRTVARNLEAGPFEAKSVRELFQPLLEEAAKSGFRPL